jgi:exoribonuclease-2
VDDGISLEALGDGKWRVWAHVADPTSVLHHTHMLVDSARIRATSMYLPYTTVPMFPWSLAAGPMSLLPGRVRSLPAVMHHA